MSLNTSNVDALIDRLSWRPAHVVDSMISVSETIQSIILPRTLTFSSLGPLDTLPTELLHLIFNSLDFQSLSRFAQICHKANIVVESLPSYERMIKYASKALIALSRTKLITFHTAATIYTALLSEKCVSCQNFAAFLFLPTCERCCYECLCNERSPRVISIRMAGICFGVSPKDLGQIPIMLSIPGMYSFCHNATRVKRVRLVSLKQAKKLGISVHGSQEAMEIVSVSKKAGKLSYRQLQLARWLTGSSDSEPQNSSTPRLLDNAPNDNFCGMASISFPSLRPNIELEHGLWCYGCRVNLDNLECHGRRISFDDLNDFESGTHLLGSGVDLINIFLRREFQARSRSEFLEHTRNCKWAIELLQTEDAKTFKIDKWSSD